MIYPAIASFFENGVSGTISFTPSMIHGSVTVIMDINGLSPHQTYGIHIFEYGNFFRPGDHLNPDRKTHGSILWTPERHVGDLQNNATTDAFGRIRWTFSDSQISLDTNKPERCIIGRLVGISSFPDDMGLCGLLDPTTHKFRSYESMSHQELNRLAVERGCRYREGLISWSSLIRHFIQGSSLHGNGGSLYSRAIIGIAGPPSISSSQETFFPDRIPTTNGFDPGYHTDNDLMPSMVFP